MGLVIKNAVTAEQQAELIQAQEFQSAIDDLNQQLKSEKTARSSEDAVLNQNINFVRDTLTEEISARTAAQNQLQADLQTETNQRTAADSELQNAINTETTARQAGENTLRDEMNTAITDEQAARVKGLQDLESAIMVAMGNAKRLQDIEDEALRRQMEAEAAKQGATLSELNEKVTNEIATRENEDTKLSNAVSAEVADRQAAVTQLQNTLNAAINKEISDRQAADSQLQTDLSNALATETQNRTNALNNLDTSLKNYIGEQVSSVEENLNDFTAPTATADGKRGLVPAPPKGIAVKILTSNGWRPPDDATLTISVVPSQVGTLNYNGAAQSPSWLNFDNKKLKITGETSGTAAKTYTVTFTPLDLYMWADTLDQQPKTATWKIDALKLAKPTAAVTSFTFNNASQAINVSNFDSAYIEQSGTVSATNANSYSAVYKLKNKTNTTWSDSTTGDVTINWQINPLKLAKPAASTVEFDYDGGTKNLSVSNYNSTYINQTGTLSASAVGIYSAVYSLKNTSNTKWADNSTGNVTINWEIIQRVLSAAQSSGFVQVGTLTYDGSAQNVTIKNYDSNYHNLSGDITKTNAGTYTAKISPKGGYTWADGTATPKDVSWTINKKSLAKPTVTTDFFPYDGNTKTLDIKNYNSFFMTQTGTSSASEAGEYSVKFTLNSTANTQWADSTTAAVNISWQIGSQSLPKPTAATTVFTYNDNVQTLNVANYNSKYINQTGTVSAKDAGEYSVTYSLKNPAHAKWSDNSTGDVVINWKINRRKLSAYLSTVPQGGQQYTFTGSTITLNLGGAFKSEWQQTGDWEGLHAGEYTALVEPDVNYCWDTGTIEPRSVSWEIIPKKIEKPIFKDGVSLQLTFDLRTHNTGEFLANFPQIQKDIDAGWLEANKTPADPSRLDFKPNNYFLSEVDVAKCSQYIRIPAEYKSYGDVVWNDNSNDDFIVNWEIVPYVLPFCKNDIFQIRPAVYDGVERRGSAVISVMGEEYIGYDIDRRALNTADYDYMVDIDGRTVEFSVGRYSFRIVPLFVYKEGLFKDGDVVFSDGTYEPIVVNWEIIPLPLEFPIILQNEFEYDGSSHQLLWEKPENWNGAGVRVVQSPNASKIEIGTYQETFTIFNTTNLTWEDGTTDPIVIEWSIGMQKISAPTMTASTFTYDGNSHAPTFEGVNTASMTLGGTTSAVNAGSYVATVSIKNTDSYVWEDATSAAKEYAWKINRKPLTSTQSTFSQSGTLTYTGSAQTVTINNYDANYHTLGGVYISTNAGEFVAQISPRDNYCWNDGTFAPKYVSWKINPIKIAKPTASVKEFTYDRQAHALNISNFNSDYMTQTGNISATAAGNYSAVYKLKNTTNINWADSSIADVVIAWNISKTRLTKPTAATLEFAYNGQNKTLSISNYNSSFMTQSGVTQAKDAGEYSVVYSLNDKETTEWDDASTSDVTLNWQITPQPMPVANSAPYQKAFPSFTLNGSSILSTAYISGYNATYQDWSGTTSAVNAGTYTAYVTPTANYCWNTGTRERKTVTWKINPAKVDEPSISADLTYTGSAQSPTLTGYNASKMELSGDTSKTDAGDYVLKVQPKENFVWSSDGTRDIKSLDWKIAPILIEYVRFTQSAGSAGYYGNGTNVAQMFNGEKIYIFGENNSLFDSRVKNFDETLMTWSGTTNATEHGSYVITFKTKDANHVFYNRQREHQIYWEILQKPMAPPALKDNGVLSYTGAEISPFDYTAVQGVASYKANLVTVTGTTAATARGNYSATFKLKYPQNSYWFNTKLSEYENKNLHDTTDKTFNWSIGVTQITAPSISTTYFDYNGSAKTVTISGFDSNTMTKSGTESASARGFYKVTFSLKDKNNTCWSTGGSADIVIEWAIGKKRVAKPTLADGASTEFTYNGSAKTLSVAGYDADTMTQTGYLSATDAGSYTVIFALKDSSTYVWQDNSTANVSFTWKINKAVIPDVTLSQSGTLTYTGQNQTVTIKNFNASTMEIFVPASSTSGANGTAANAGSYQTQIRPKANYTWADGSVTSKTVRWIINKKSLAKPTASTLYFAYDGNAHSLTVSGFDSTYMNQTGDISATDAGNYSAVYSLKNSNVQWEDASTGDVTINWSIGSKIVAIPTVSPVTQTSKGLHKTHSVTVSGFDSSRMTQSGTVSVNSGKQATYNVYFALKDSTNDSWYGGSKSTQTVTWSVMKKVLTAAESSFVQTNAITYDGKAHSVTEACSAIKADYIGEYYTISNATQTDAGTFTATITPTNAACWNDLTTTAKTLSWTISAANSTFALGTTDATISVSAPPLTNTSGNYVKQISFTSNSDGDILLESSDYNVVRFSPEGFAAGTKTIQASAGKITLYPFANGEATVTVTQKASGGYGAVTKTLRVKVTTPVIFLEPSNIQTLVKNGTLLNYMRIGDCFKIGILSGTVNSNSVNCNAAAYLIGYNHNAGIEGNNRAHFAIFAGTYINQKAIPAKSVRSNNDGNSTQTNYNNSVLRTSCNEFFNLLPTKLQNVITACKKYSGYPGTGTGGTYGYAYVTDKIWVPSAWEVSGQLQQSTSPRTCAYIEQYEYWANGNSKAFGSDYWLRDVETSASNVAVYMMSNGSLANTIAQNNSYGLLPCFTIS